MADQIYAVIRGTSINHGGKTNGYTVPNPQAQKELVRAALAKAGVNARHGQLHRGARHRDGAGRSDRDQRADAGVCAGHGGEAVLRDRLGEVEHRASGGAAGIAGRDQGAAAAEAPAAGAEPACRRAQSAHRFCQQPVRGAAGAVRRGSGRWWSATGSAASCRGSPGSPRSGPAARTRMW